MTFHKLMLIAALAGGLAACGDKTEAGSEPVSAEEQEVLDQVPTQEEADAAAAEEITADNLEETMRELEENG